MAQHHQVNVQQRHFGWDNSLHPVIHIAPGDRVTFDMLDASGGQIVPDSSAADIETMDSSRVNPGFGPVAVEGAEPGDALRITVLEIRTHGWGWTANIPGFGLLADRFPDPALHIWRFDPNTLAPAKFAPGGRVPLKPFPGIMGVAPAESGVHNAVTPLITGGNMDTRDLSEGAVLMLPVKAPGALFSAGDGHAAQGDGEVCGTAIECPMRLTLRFEVEKNAGLRYPTFTTPGPPTRHVDALGYEVTMGVGPDLMESARNAVSDMVDRIARRRGMEPVEAYMLCSVCADLRISEIVDAPHPIVSCYFPRVVFGG